MSDEINRFDLRRHIPSEVARAVRQRCGFGCVVCGAAIYDYEHFNPEFKDARIHDPSGIVLLCPNHHRAKGGFISISKLNKCASSPFCKSTGFSHTEMDIDKLVVNVGPLTADHCRTVLEIKSVFCINKIAIRSALVSWLPAWAIQAVTKAIWFEPPEEEGAPLRLNLVINDASNAKIAWIDNNIWHGSAKAFDISIVAGKERSRIKVMTCNKRAILDLEFLPPNKINLSRFYSYYSGQLVEIAGNKEGGFVNLNGRTLISGSGLYVGHSNAALSL